MARKTKEQKDSEILEVVKNRFKIASDYQEPIFNKFVRFYEYYRMTNTNQDVGTWKADIRVPFIKQVVDTILPRMVASKPKINILPRGEEDIEDAQSNEKLINYQWEKMRMYKKIKMWSKQALLYGVGLLKIGWEYDEESEKDGLWCEIVSIFDFYISPSSTNIDDTWVIFKQDRDLEELKKNKNYNTKGIEGALSSEDNEFKTSQRASLGRSNPSKDNRNKVTVYEYYGKMDLGKGYEESAMVVTADNKAILRIAPLKEVYPCGIPFVALHDDPMPLEFWSIGEIEPLTAMQDELNTLRNQRLDNRSLNINTMWLVNKNGGINWDDFVSRPSGVIECDDINAVKPLPIQDMTGGSVQEEAIVKQDMQNTSGVQSGMTGQINNTIGGSSPITGTARGFLASIEQAGTRLQYKLDNLDDALQELGQKMLKMNAKYITSEQKILITGKAGMQFDTIKPQAINKEYDLKVEGGSTQPQNKEARTQQYLQMLQAITPYFNMQMYDYEPGQAAVPTTLNAKYFIDNLLNNADLPNREEAYVDQQSIPPPPQIPQDIGNVPPEGQIYGEAKPEQSISAGGSLPQI